jgi:hypothetical protein
MGGAAPLDADGSAKESADEIERNLFGALYCVDLTVEPTRHVKGP